MSGPPRVSALRTRVRTRVWLHPHPLARSGNQIRKTACVWPMKSPSAVRALAAPIAAPFVSVGRIIEQIGNFRLRNGHGSGMIRLSFSNSDAVASGQVHKRAQMPL